MNTNLTTVTGLTEAVAERIESSKQAREALAKAATEGNHESLANLVNVVAECEGAVRTYSLALGIVQHMVETNMPAEEKRPNRLLSTLVAQTTRTDDICSGHRNDTHRAFEAGVRAAVRDISDQVIWSLGKGDTIG